MQETEVKILEINRPKIEKTLRGLGAEKVFEGKIETLFLDFKDNRITGQGNLLRLRTKEKQTELTFKEVKHGQEAKVAEEISVEVSDKEAMMRILEHLGIGVTGRMEKHRVSYKLKEAKFDMDRYLGDYTFIPEFLEIEAQNIEKIHRNADALGYRPEDCLPWSTGELIRHYRKEKKPP
jgi:adenylate cyclase, class 2